MSDFILNYEILESIIKDSRTLGKQSEEYAEGLDSKITGAIENVMGPPSGNLISAYDSVRDKIKVLKQKADDFYHYAEQISNLLEVAQQVDQEVADAIVVQKENFIDRHKSQRLENWKEKLLNLLVEVKVCTSLLKLISRMLARLSHTFKSSIDVIKDWYRTAGEETIGIPGWMAGYEKNNFRTFRDLKNSILSDNVDLKNSIKQWYKNPKSYSTGTNKTDAAEKLYNSDRPLLAYERDLEKIKYSKNPFQTIKYLGKYFWDRFPGLYAHNMEQLAIIGGMDPEWAKIAGDFTSMSVLEGFATITVNGVRAYKNFRTGQIIYNESVVVGSGIGNITKEVKAGSRAIEDGVSKANPEKVVNALSNYGSKNWTFGNEEFMLDKSSMKHILERHHPEYWDGSIKSTQTFLDKGMSIDDITNTVSEVLKQNREMLIKKGTTGMYQIEGIVDGIDYVVGLNKGKIGQFFKK